MFPDNLLNSLRYANLVRGRAARRKHNTFNRRRVMFEQFEERTLLAAVNPFLVFDNDQAFGNPVGHAVKQLVEFAAGGLDAWVDFDEIRDLVEAKTQGIDAAGDVASVSLNFGAGVSVGVGLPVVDASLVAFDAGIGFSWALSKNEWTIARGIELESIGTFEVGAEEFITFAGTEVFAGVKISGEAGVPIPPISFGTPVVGPRLSVDVDVSNRWTYTIEESFTTSEFIAATGQSDLDAALLSVFTPFGDNWKQKVASVIGLPISAGLDLLGLADFNNSPIQLLDDGTDGIPESRVTEGKVASLGLGFGIGGDVGIGVNVGAGVFVSIGIEYEDDVHTKVLNPTNDAPFVEAIHGIPYSVQPMDPDGTIATANRIAFGQTSYESIDPAGDVDWFAFTLPASDTIGVTIEQPSGLDAQLNLYRDNGTRLAFSQGGFTTDLPAGDYRIAVSSYAAHHTGDYSLRLSRRQLGDSLEISAIRMTDEDDDGLREGHEDVELRIRLRNTDNATVTDLEGVLVSSVSNMDITPPAPETRDWPQLSPDEIAYSIRDWNVFLQQDSYDDLPFALHVTYDVNDVPYYQNMTFTEDFHAPSNPGFEVIDFTIDDSVSRSEDNNGDGVIQSGEDIRIRPRLRSVGDSGATGLDVSMIYHDESPNRSTSVLDLEIASESYPDLGRNDSAYPGNSSSFSLRNIRQDFAGTVSLDVQVTADQLAQPLVLENAIQVEVAAAPWIRVSENEHSFGVAAPGDSVTHTATVTNVGSAAMQVTGFESFNDDATVTTDSLPFTLQPAESRNISMSIDTTGIASGTRIERTVTVLSNGRFDDPADTRIVITGLVSNEVPVFRLPTPNPSSVDVSGDWIVYADSRNGNRDVFAYQISTGDEIQLTTDNLNQASPRISGNLVVWDDYRNWDGLSDTDIRGRDLYGYDLSLRREFAVATDVFAETLVGVDSEFVAFTRGYYEFTGQTNADVARDLVVLEYDGNGGFTERFDTNYTLTSGLNPKKSAGGGDFGGGLLAFSSFTRAYRTDVNNPHWERQDNHFEIINLMGDESTPTRFELGSNAGVTVAGKVAYHVEFEDADENDGEQVFIWDNGASRRLTVPGDNEVDHGEDVLAISTSGFVVYDKSESENLHKLFYWDLNANQNDYPESLLTQQVLNPEKGRMDKAAIAFLATSAEDGQKYVHYAFLGQGELSVEASDITFGSDSLDEGDALDVAVTVHNVNNWDTSGQVVVRLFDGDPDAGGLQWGNDAIVPNAIVGRGQTVVTFSELVVPASWEGEREIFARVLPAVPDSVGNNTAHATLDVSDADLEGPVFSNVRVLEKNGDGDGLIATDEQIEISWDLSDASGIESTTLWVDVDGDGLGSVGARDSDDAVPVVSVGVGVLSLLTPGHYQFVIDAVDSDVSPEVSEYRGELEVLETEEITVSIGMITLMDDSSAAVDFGDVELDANSVSKVFRVSNEGNQTLTLFGISTPDGFSASLPSDPVIEPGDIGFITISLVTDSLGDFSGKVLIENSDNNLSPDGSDESVFEILVSGRVQSGPSESFMSVFAADATKAEGSSGVAPFNFTITRSGDVSAATSVGWNVDGSGANAANAVDFGGTLPAGQVNFASDQTTATITVEIAGDMDVEPDESFKVTLSNPSNETVIVTESATGVILNDDSVQTSPVLVTIGNQPVDEGSTLTFTATASDVDVPTQNLTFSLDPGAPAGASIDPDSGLFTWTPSEDQGPSAPNVTVRVTDNGTPNLDDFETIVITVREVNEPPVLMAIGNQSVDEGSTLTFTATASDVDVPTQNLTFSLGEGAPAGASIDPDGGVFTWTPGEMHDPHTFDVVVSDGVATDLEPITVTVDETSGVPRFVISPTMLDPNDLPTGAQPTSWTQQKSDMREIVIQLAAPITSVTASDLVLTNLGVNAPVDSDVVVPLSDDQLSISNDGMQLRLSFAANPLDDGVYQLDLLAEITGGASFTITGNETNNFFVLTGDWNGSGGVNIQDFATFAYWFGKSVPTAPEYADVNGSGGINIQDFAGFATNFGKSTTFPATTPALSAGGSSEGELESALRTLINPSDVDGDGLVTTVDALKVMDEVARGRSVGRETWSRFDTTRDGKVTSRDALFVINRLAEQTQVSPTGSLIRDSTREAEAESPVVSSEQRLPTSKKRANIPTGRVDAVHAALMNDIDSADASLDAQQSMSLDDTIELLSHHRS